MFPQKFRWIIDVEFQNKVDVYTTVTLPDQAWATFHSQITTEGPKLLGIVKCSEGLDQEEIKQAFLNGQLMMTPPVSNTLQ